MGPKASCSTKTPEYPADLEARVNQLAETVAAFSSDREVIASLERRLAALECKVTASLGTHEPEPAKVPLEPDDRDAGGASEAEGARCCVGPEFSEYSVAETAWDMCFIVGLPGVSWTASAIAIICGLLNVLVQGYMSYVLLTSGSFVVYNHYKELISPMERWRHTVGHEESQLDSAGISLVRRVCSGDEALAVAGSQANLVQQINSFVGLGVDELEMRAYCPGMVLCAVCILLFTVLVMKELRSIWAATLGVCGLKRGSTRLEGNALVSISTARFAATMLVMTARTVVATVLLVAGVMWLSSTGSTTDLILNAAALGFIMDLDELLFETMMPMQVQALLRSLEPLRYRQPRFHLEAVLPLLATLAVVAAMVGTQILPNTRDMVSVKEVLCGGTLDFATAKAPTGIIVSVKTPAFDTSETGKPDLAKLAVMELTRFDFGSARPPKYAMVAVDAFMFDDWRQQTFAKLSETSICTDLDVWRSGWLIGAMPFYFMTIREVTGLNAGASLEDTPFRCIDHLGYCDSVGIVRFLCPITCGCADPTSGALFAGSVQGCPATCEALRKQALADVPCADRNVTALPGWRRYWETYNRWFSENFPAEAGTLRSFTEHQIASSCAEVRRDPISNSSFCDRTCPVLQGHGMGSIVGFCQAHCCSGSNLEDNVVMAAVRSGPIQSARNCAAVGADYAAVHGVGDDRWQDALTLNFVTLEECGSNFGLRVYLKNSDGTYKIFKQKNQAAFSLDVDVCSLPCGCNGTGYFVEMDKRPPWDISLWNSRASGLGTEVRSCGHPDSSGCNLQGARTWMGPDSSILRFLQASAGSDDWNAGTPGKHGLGGDDVFRSRQRQRKFSTEIANGYRPWWPHWNVQAADTIGNLKTKIQDKRRIFFWNLILS